MSRPVDALDSAFPIAASIALDLIRHPEVAARWSRPSALPHLSVGALACHLGRQAIRAAELLPASADLPTLESADSHYERAAWVTEGTPDEDAVAAGPDEADALRGPDDLHARSGEALTQVNDLLTRGAALDLVPIPWQGWSLRRADFLLTRQLEIVVHSDDLAVSVGVPTPVFPAGVFDPVRDLLVRLAVRRHGQSALIGALSRSERARDISAF
ncbi:maleylpyruvate isomerase N-terminal domain-containing protein [Micromonospora sp. NPDC005979]|uniref:maleylpyruvate isomerase N-terminal domain-containing protein n=1 Tax=Micromonospora sp. NPDC005979 TaxID=3156726 RepID=UPI0033BEBA91